MKTLKYAVRFLVRSRSYSLINLFGLAFSLACSIILLRYIHRELTVDTHCVDRERVVVPVRDITVNTSLSTTEYSDTVFIPENKILRRSYVDCQADESVKYNHTEYQTNVLFTDSEFLNIFNYRVMAGTPQLDAPNQAILTQKYAQSLFGTDNAVGKQLEYGNKLLTVTAVIAQPMCKTTLHFDVLFSIDLKEHRYTEYIQLLPGVDIDAINEVSNVYKKIVLPDGSISSLSHRFEFVKMKDLYFLQGLHEINYHKGFYTYGSRDYLNILFIVAVLLLFVGVMNFINLYMVYMMKRKKEYGIKKVYGLQRGPLFLQIWLENFLLAFWALMVAWLIIEITQVPVSQLMGVEMEYTPFDLYLSLGFLLLLPLLTSVYPYLRHQYMAPITSMRAIANSRQSVATRMMLLSVQYVVTFVLMVFSLYLNKHFRFLLDTPTGFRTERVLEAKLTYDIFRTKGSEAHRVSEAEVAKKLDECADILSWTGSGNILEVSKLSDTFLNEKDEQAKVFRMLVNESFFKVFDVNVTEGELPETFGSFQDEQVVINKATMKALGFERLEEAFVRCEGPLGMDLREDGIIKYGTSLFPITAVIENFYPGHVTEGIKPIVLQLEHDNYLLSNYAWIHVAEGKEQAVIDYLRKIIFEVYGTDELEYTWLSDKVKAIYDEDRRIATIYTIFALIAIGVSCLGLFGISLFDIRQRYREIGIRKVNGAGMKDLYKLLFRKYVLILVASFAVAIPLVWYAIHIYTADFVVKAPVGIDVFLIALLVIALISLGTLYWQIRKAANINPSIVMKRE